jgi:hypothetical protein
MGVLFQSSFDVPYESNGVVYVPGKSGQPGDTAAKFAGLGPYVRVPQLAGGTVNVNPVQGSIEYDFQPIFNSGDDVKRAFWAVGTWNKSQSKSMLAFGKHAPANQRTWWLIFYDQNMTRNEAQIPNGDVVFSAGQWTRWKFTWDHAVAVGAPNYHVWFNDVELAVPVVTGNMTGPKTCAGPAASEWLWIGSRGESPTSFSCDGAFDNFLVSDTP